MNVNRPSQKGRCLICEGWLQLPVIKPSSHFLPLGWHHTERKFQIWQCFMGESCYSFEEHSQEFPGSKLKKIKDSRSGDTERRCALCRSKRKFANCRYVFWIKVWNIQKRSCARLAVCFPSWEVNWTVTAGWIELLCRARVGTLSGPACETSHMCCGCRQQIRPP